MAQITIVSPRRRSAEVGLAPGIARVLLVKALVLAALWLLFVRGQGVTVDARATAAAFGLSGAAQNAKVKSEGDIHGQ